MLTDGETPATAANPELDPKLSFVPRNNIITTDYDGDGEVGDGEDVRTHLQKKESLEKGNGLGDYDDILMLTVRNENEPFVGRVPANVRLGPNAAARFDVDDRTPAWSHESIESPLAEVVWYAVENPVEDADNDGTNDSDNFFGEPGMRTIYRRTLLIAPWVNPYHYVDGNGVSQDTFQIAGDSTTFRAEPGLVRILPADKTQEQALAALIAFQDRYDLSIRLEFDPLLDPANSGRWKIVANTLGDLTKRENRYEHHFLRPGSGSNPGVREFPFAVASLGSGYSGSSANVVFVPDPDIGGPSSPAQAQANLAMLTGVGKFVLSYTIDPLNLKDPPQPTRRYAARPLAFVKDGSTTVATARAMLNDDGEVVRVVRGLVPLSGSRRGEDVMITNALAFDLRVYDPGAPLFGHTPTGTVLEPSDPGWYRAYASNDNMKNNGSGKIGNGNAAYPYIGQGAYVDLGYGFDTRPAFLNSLASPVYALGISHADPWFFDARVLSDVYGKQLAPGYTVYDTWSFHYENDGLNEDGDEINGSTGLWQLLDNDAPGSEDDMPQVDEGTNGFDDPGVYSDGSGITRLGADDIGEHETAPPYDKPLRGVEVILRAYETDSRQIRQVSVKEHFVPE